MEAIFSPRSVAVIGASDNPGKLGFHVMKSLTQGKYPGKIYPVNPGKNEILGIKTYPSLPQVPDTIDLSIIALPAEQLFWKTKILMPSFLCIMFASANRSAVGILTDLLSERRTNKPILCWFSSPAGIWNDEIKRLEGSGIPNYSSPERAAKTLVNLYRFKNTRG